MAKKTKAKLKLHAAAKRQKNQAALAGHGKGGKALAAVHLAKPVGEIGFLRRIYKLGRGSVLAGQERIELVSEFAKRIDDADTNPKHFGAKNAREVAELFVKEMEEMNIRPKTFRAFISHMRIEAYQSRVRGKLFHLFVRNFEPLQRDFWELAAAQVDELNNPKFLGTHPSESKPEVLKLVNAKGDEIQGPVKFGNPRKAQRIRIRKKDGTVVEFIDDVFASYSGQDDAMLWSFLIEIEVKTAGAAKGFSEQIGFAQLRMMAEEVKHVEMVVEGFKKTVIVEPENLIFSPRSVDRNAVTSLSKSQWTRLTKDEQVTLEKGDQASIYKASGFRFQSTSKGQGETFRRVTLAVNTDALNRIVRAILPRYPMKK